MRTSANDAGSDAALKIEIERIFDASRARVFEMWTRPAHLQMWFAPKGFTIPDARTDFREGGDHYVHMRSAAGKDHREQGTYVEIVENARIVMTHAWLDEHGEAGPETRVTVSFEDYGAGTYPKTKMTFVQEGFTSAASRDDHAAGWNECFDRLQSYLSSIAEPR